MFKTRVNKLLKQGIFSQKHPFSLIINYYFRAKVEAKNLYFYLKQNSDDVSTTQELSIIFQILVANRVGVKRFRQVVPRNGRAPLETRKLSKASIGSDDLEDVFLPIDEPKVRVSEEVEQLYFQKILSSSTTIVVIEIKAPEFVLEVSWVQAGSIKINDSGYLK